MKEYLANNKMVLYDKCNHDVHDYAIRDWGRKTLHRCDLIDFTLLKHLLEPRNMSSLRQYFARLKQQHRAELFDTDLAGYVKRFLMRKLIVEVDPGFQWDEASQSFVVDGGIIQPPNQRSFHSIPANIGVNVTNDCNLRCRHCSQEAGLATSHCPDGRMSYKELSNLFDQFDDHGVEIVRLTGGEPTVHPEFDKIFQAAADHRFKLYLFTNAHSLSDARCKLIKKVCYQKGGNFLLHLSLDGGTPDVHDWFRGRQGAFERVTANAKKLSSMGIPLYFELVLNRRNMHQLDQVLKVSKASGAGSIGIHTASSVGSAANIYVDDLHCSIAETREIKRTINRLRVEYRGKNSHGIRFSSYNWPLLAVGKKLLRKNKYDELPPTDRLMSPTDNNDDKRRPHRCSGGTGQACVGADGKLYSCPNASAYPEFAAGDLRKESFIDVWRNGQWGIFRQLWYIEDMQFCRECKWVDTQCSLGYMCRPAGYGATGDICGPPAACILSFNELGVSKRTTLEYLRRCNQNPDKRWKKAIASYIDYVNSVDA